MRFAHRHWESSHHLSLSLSTPHRQARGFQARGVPGPDRSLPSSAVVVGIVACCMIAFAVCIANLRAPPSSPSLLVSSIRLLPSSSGSFPFLSSSPDPPPSSCPFFLRPPMSSSDSFLLPFPLLLLLPLAPQSPLLQFRSGQIRTISGGSEGPGRSGGSGGSWEPGRPGVARGSGGSAGARRMARRTARRRIRSSAGPGRFEGSCRIRRVRRIVRITRVRSKKGPGGPGVS